MAGERAHEEVEEEAEKFKKIADHANYGVAMATLDGNLTYVNDYFASVHGYEPDELTGKNFSVFHNEEQLEQVRKLAEELRETGSYTAQEIWHQHRDGSAFPMLMNGTVIKDDKGNPLFMAATAIDITERKRMEEELKASEEWHRSVFEGSRDAIFITGADSRFVDVNEAAEALTGYSKEELRGMSIPDIHDASDLHAFEAFFDRIMGGEPVTSEAFILRKDGKKVPTEFSNRRIVVRGVPYMHTVARDITMRKQYEEKLEAIHRHAKELRLSKTPKEIAETTFDVVERFLGFDIGGFGVVEGGLLRFIHILGAESEVYEMPLDGPGITVRAIRTGETQLVPDIREDEDYVRGVRILESLSELAVPVRVEGEVVAVLNVESTEVNAFDDNDRSLLETLAEHVASAISRQRRVEILERLVDERTMELKDAQEQLLKSERMAAIGETAAMVGHDLRNPLQVIFNTLYLIETEFDTIPLACRKYIEESGMVEQFGIVEKQVEYVNKIVSDLQDYARPLKPQLIETSMRRLIDDILSAIAIPESVEVSIAIEEEFPELYVDPTLMKRTFTNLITNALQAMPDGGRLTIRGVKTGESASINVQDTGVGIPEEDLEKIFQPLFTTKPTGAGLGLSVCQRLVNAHSGTISVDSQVDVGSTFTVQIPLGRR